ncbi:HEAT repeat domain-containing protein [Myxococcota bacterium]|nr:HEAT repeat domain-containing protein [Myxococcota bacterium]
MKTALRSWTLWIGSALLAGTALGAVTRPMGPRDALTLSHSDFYKVRLASARLLARRDDDPSRRRLEAMLADPHPLVRRTVATTLERGAPTADRCPTAALGGAP